MLLILCVPLFLLATTRLTFCDTSIVVDEIHLSIPQTNQLTTNQKHYLSDKGHSILRQIYYNNIIGEHKIAVQRHDHLNTGHFLADAAHNVLKELNSNQHTDKVPI